MNKTNIVVFASGSGTNAEEIFKYFASHSSIAVCGLLTNNPGAKVLSRAEKHHIPSRVFSRDEFSDSKYFLEILNNWDADAIVLAGFLWLLPAYLIDRYPEHILNIHPALLPKYGGKGMYGMHVHRAVLDSGEKESGITIHLVNREYDKGSIIFQRSCTVNEGETPESLAAKIHTLEHRYYPAVIEDWLLSKGISEDGIPGA